VVTKTWTSVIYNVFCDTSPSQEFHYKIRGRTGEYGHMCFGRIYQYEKI